MSKSLMDAIRQTISEGAKEKTADGMTPDAKHFRQDLHKVQDAGFKHMVQKDSETADYAKMFNGGVDKAPTRLADYEPKQDLDKYVEYNEEMEIEEAKKGKHDKDCDCDDCSADSEDEDMKEEIVQEVSAAGPATAQASTAYLGRLTTARQVAREPKAPPPLINPRGATPVGPRPEPKAIPGGTAAGIAARLGDTPGASQSAAAAPNPMASMAKGRAAERGTTAPNPMASMAAGRAAERSLKPKPPKAPGAGTTPPPKKPRFSGGGEHGAIPPGLGATFSKQGPSGALKQIPGGAKLKTGGQVGGIGLRKNSYEIEMGDNTYIVSEDQLELIAAVLENRVEVSEDWKETAKKVGLGLAIANPITSAPTVALLGAKKIKDYVSGSNKTPDTGASGPRRGGAALGTRAKPPVTNSDPAPVKLKAPDSGMGASGNAGKKPPKRSIAPGWTGPGVNKGRNPLGNSFEIELGDKAYIVSEAHAQAIAAFVEKHGEVNEGTAGEFISKEMKHPEKLTAKGKKQKIKQALAIFYSKKRRGENP